MPTEEHQPEYFIPSCRAIGELRVELLETDGLPSMDVMLFDENDVYAMVCFEAMAS
jgi:hypothetical protein